MSEPREKFVVEVDPANGREIQALVDEAFSDLVEKHRSSSVRSKVMEEYFTSHERFGTLYKRLAE